MEVFDRNAEKEKQTRHGTRVLEEQGKRTSLGEG